MSSNKYKLLFILGPHETSHPDLLAKKLNEMTIKMNNGWKVFALSSGVVRSINLPCSFELCRVPTVISSKGFITRVLSRILYLIISIFKGVRVVRQKNIHIIMCKGNHLQFGFVAYLISRLTNRKCIIRVSADFLISLLFSLRDSENFLFKRNALIKIARVFYRKAEIFIFRHVDWVITHGPMDFKKIKKVTNRTSFIPLWIDLEKFKPIDMASIKEFKRNLVGQKDAKILLFVGRLHPVKDIQTLLRAFKMISDTYKNVFLLIIGAGEYEEESRKLARDLKITSNTCFLGYIPHSELPIYYNIADLYILPSLREEWSNTIMEAMACKTPVIATEVGGNPYLVVEGKTGFLVPPKNPTFLAKKIQFVLENEDLSKRISDKAFHEIKKYDKDAIGELFKSVIKNVTML